MKEFRRHHVSILEGRGGRLQKKGKKKGKDCEPVSLFARPGRGIRKEKKEKGECASEKEERVMARRKKKRSPQCKEGGRKRGGKDHDALHGRGRGRKKTGRRGSSPH